MKKLYLMPLFFLISSFQVYAWKWNDLCNYVGQFGDNVEAWFVNSSTPDRNLLVFRGSGDFYSKYRQESANEGSHPWDWCYYDGHGLWTMDINTSCNIVEFRGNIVSVPDVAFRNWRTVKEVTLSQSVQCIGYRSFMDCDGLKEVTFYGNTIGRDAFKGCDALETFTIDPKHGQVNIGQQSFSWFGPKKFIIKSNDPDCAYVHPEAFYEARHDITLCVPRAALEAYNNHPQWKNWWRIESIENELTLEEHALNPTSGKSYGMNWSFDDGLLCVGGVQTIHKSNMDGIPVNFDSITDIIIEEGVKELAFEALYQNYNNVRTLRLPETLEKLDRYCLGFFWNIEKLKILSPTLNVNAWTVRYMPTLKEMWLCAEPTVTGDGAVFDNFNFNFNCLLYVEGDLNFYKKTEPWSKFSNIQLMGNMGECGDIVDWKMENNTLTLEGRKYIDNYPNPQDLPWYSLRDSIRTIIIGNHASSDRNITYVGRNIIGNCPNLEKVILNIKTPPDLSVTTTIQNINLHKVVLEVPYQSLNAYRNALGWEDFENITFATSGQCGDSAFWKYEGGLLTISGKGPTYNYPLNGPYSDWYSIRHLIKTAVVGEGITNIGSCLFWNHSNMTTAEISSTVTSISYCAFVDCKNLLEADLPDNLNFLGPSAFSRCYFLQNTVIPRGIDSLNWGQFYSCTGLTYVGCRNPNPPTIGDANVFYDVNINDMILYVPEESIEKYKAASFWKNFRDIQKLGNMPSQEVTSKESSSVTYSDESNFLPYITITEDTHAPIIRTLPFLGYASPNRRSVGVEGTGWNIYSEHADPSIHYPEWRMYASYGVAVSDSINYLTTSDTIFQLPRIPPPDYIITYETLYRPFWENLEVYNFTPHIITVTPEGEVIPLANGMGRFNLYRIGITGLIPPERHVVDGFYADCRTWIFNVTGIDEVLLKYLKVNSDLIELSDTSEYTITYPYTSSVAEIRVLQKHATSKLEGVFYDSAFKDYYVKKNLAAGDNFFHFAVRSKDGSQLREYTVNVKRTGEPRLKSLNVSEGALHPQFNPDIYEYRVDIPYTKEITVTAQSYDPSNFIKGTGKYSLDPANGEVVYEVTSTSPDGLTKTYYLHVVSTEAVLKTLKVSHDESTLFTYNESNFNHTLYVGHNVEHVNIEVEAYKAESVEGTGSQTLNAGENLLSITITDKNGTKKTYYFTIVRAKNSDATLKTLSATAIDVSRGRVISEEAISLNFKPDIFNHKVLLPNTVDSIKINAIPERGTSTVTGTGTHPLNVGDNPFELKVRAADGTILVYTVNARRISADAGLGYLTVSYDNEIHEFDVSKTYHTLNIENDVENITLDFAPNYPSASFRAGDLYTKPGIKSPAVGNNSFYIGVLAEDGQTDELYTVNIYRLPARSHTSSTSLREVSGELTHVYMQGQTLYIDSPAAERVTVYSVAGELLYGLNKPSGKASFTVIYPGSLLIVRGSSGWVRKVGN